MNLVVQRMNRAKEIAKVLRTDKVFATELLNNFKNVDELLECFGAVVSEYLEEKRFIEYEDYQEYKEYQEYQECNE